MATPSRMNRRSPLLTAVMLLFLVYTLVPLVWLILAATKTQGDLFSSPGLWVGDKFSLFSNIGDTLTYKDGIFLRWLGNTVLYVVQLRGSREAM